MKYLTPKDIAEKIQMSPAAVIQMIKTGQLSATQFSISPKSKKPRYRISPESFDAFVQGRQVIVRDRRPQRLHPTVRVV